jgi:hypothetical protein
MHYVADTPAPRLLNFAVCDDIRAERENKITLIGYYGRSIVVGNIPGLLPKLCFLAQFGLFSNPVHVTFRVLSPSGVVLIHAPEVEVPLPSESSLVPEEYRNTQLVFQIAPMQVPEQGVYRVEFRFSDSRIVDAAFYVSPVKPAAR